METAEKPIIIVSKDKNKEIEKWILNASPKVRVVEFYHLSADSQKIILNQASGIVMGGGEDIDPAYYGREDALELCGKIDHYRDSIEMVLLDYAKSKNIPIFGICRGLQIMNVRYGGTLFVDLPTEMPSEIKHSQTGVLEAHTIVGNKNSRMFQTIGMQKLMVNSTHHQAIKNLAPIFDIQATASDGVIEAIDLKNNSNWFAAAVQWHPERIYNEPSKNLCMYFLQAVLTK